MTATLFHPLVFLAALGSGLVAGVFFAFSTFVMAALARLPAPAGAAAMNAINVTVLTPAFMSVLFGTALVSLAVAVLAMLNWTASGAALALAGAVLYVAGVILVTMFFNVPVNNQLAAVAPGSPAEAELWQRYLQLEPRANSCLARFPGAVRPGVAGLTRPEWQHGPGSLPGALV